MPWRMWTGCLPTAQVIEGLVDLSAKCVGELQCNEVERVQLWKVISQSKDAKAKWLDFDTYDYPDYRKEAPVRKRQRKDHQVSEALM